MIEIKKALATDAAVLTHLARETFIQTFAQHNTEEDMTEYVSRTHSKEKQLAEIQDPNRIIQIAWIENQAVGFLHLLRNSHDPSVQGPNPIELLRIYVDSKWHGKNVGGELMKRSIQIAKSEGYKTLWLGVWEKNHRALKFYEKFAFKKVGSHIFMMGQSKQNDYILAREL